VILGLLVSVAFHRKVEALGQEQTVLDARLQKANACYAELSIEVDMAKGASDSNKQNIELLELREDARRLRGVQSELVEIRETLQRMQDAEKKEEAEEKFKDKVRETNLPILMVRVVLKTMRQENRLALLFNEQGKPNFEAFGKRVSESQLKGIEFVVNDPGLLTKLLDEKSQEIIARTKNPIPTPDGRYFRHYLLANGNVMGQSDTTDQPRSGSWGY
jgi:hypothetical protein